jgi:hypothetical protein
LIGAATVEVLTLVVSAGRNSQKMLRIYWAMVRTWSATLTAELLRFWRLCDDRRLFTRYLLSSPTPWDWPATMSTLRR